MGWYQGGPAADRERRTALESRSLCLPARPRSTCPTSSAAEFGGNASYVAELLSRFRANPSSVDDEWRNYFRQRFGEQEPAPAAPAPAAAPASPATPLGPAVEGERATLRGGALRIAENMEASLGVPTATTQRQVPIKLADENRRLINEHRAALEQSKVSFTHLVSWAVIQALKSFPVDERRVRRLERRARPGAPRRKSGSASPSTCRRRTARGRCSCRT